MDIHELKSELDRIKVNPNYYSLTGASRNECYVLSKEGSDKWSIFYSERGLHSSLMTFDSENAACEEFFKWLLNDPTVFDKPGLRLDK